MKGNSRDMSGVVEVTVRASSVKSERCVVIGRGK